MKLIISDVTGYGRSVKWTTVATWTSFVFGGGFVFLVSILLGRMSAGSDLAAIMPGLGMVAVGVPFLVLATWTTNDPNVYVASLAVAAVIKGTRKWVLALALGIVEKFLPWLSLIGMVFAPAGAVFMLDYFFHPDRYDRAHEKPTATIRIRPILAWLAGTVVTSMTSKPSALGLGLFTLLVASGLFMLLVELPGALRLSTAAKLQERRD